MSAYFHGQVAEGPRSRSALNAARCCRCLIQSPSIPTCVGIGRLSTARGHFARVWLCFKRRSPLSFPPDKSGWTQDAERGLFLICWSQEGPWSTRSMGLLRWSKRVRCLPWWPTSVLFLIPQACSTVAGVPASWNNWKTLRQHWRNSSEFSKTKGYCSFQSRIVTQCFAWGRSYFIV
jgi:hypothetical protein